MILYSIIPAEVVFQNINENDQGIESEEIQYMGEKVEISHLKNNKFMIKRLISSDPSLYLNPELQPGTIIEAKVGNYIENQSKI